MKIGNKATNKGVKGMLRSKAMSRTRLIGDDINTLHWKPSKHAKGRAKKSPSDGEPGRVPERVAKGE